MTQILDGKAVAAEIKSELKSQMSSQLNRPICLAVVLCTDNPASRLYVQMKRQACEDVGITSLLIEPFQGGVEKYDNPEQHLLSTIEWLNNDPSVHGILVQLPLPDVIDTFKIFDKIHPYKDVDVFNPVNVGLLMQNRPRFIPCTPHGVQELLYRSGVEIAGKSVVIINRSDIVGKPLSALLMQDDGTKANATVKVCHDRTPPEMLQEVCLNSDIIVVAVGKRGFLTPDMVSERSIVVDVGINRIPNSKKICGDCAEGVFGKVAAQSLVPGGCGPMTIVCLLKNTFKAWKILQE